MAIEERESGGVVTTVKQATTLDLDVAERLREANEEAEAAGEKSVEAAKPTPKAAVKSNERVKVDDIVDDDDEYIPVDFNSLDQPQQKAVARVYKDRRETRRELQQLKSTVNDLQRQLREKPQESKPEPAKPAQAETQRPVPPDPRKYKAEDQAKYDADYAKYEDDLYEFRKAKDEAKQRVDAQAKKDKEVIESFEASQEEFKTAADEDGNLLYPDYADVVDNDEPMSNTMFGAVMSKGPGLLYYLATHKKEANKIYSQGDTPQAVESLLRIVFKLEMQAEEKAKLKAGDGNHANDGKKPVAAASQPKEKPEIPAKPVGGRQNAAAAQSKKPVTFKDREREIHKRNPGLFTTYDP